MGAKNLDVVITVIAVILVVLVWIMLYDSNRFVVRHYFLRDQRIKKPVKAVVLADLHNKRYGKENERLLQAIDEIRPDMILIAGDILTAKPKASLETAVDLLTKLAGKYPIYYGNGNHEHRLKLYPENYGDMAAGGPGNLRKLPSYLFFQLTYIQFTPSHSGVNALLLQEGIEHVIRHLIIASHLNIPHK